MVYCACVQDEVLNVPQVQYEHAVSSIGEEDQEGELADEVDSGIPKIYSINRYILLCVYI